jgi:uncharacterized protein
LQEVRGKNEKERKCRCRLIHQALPFMTFGTQTMQIGITGATGLIGTAVGQLAASEGHHVVAYSRRPDTPKLAWAAEVRAFNAEETLPLDASGVDCLIHLAGEPVLGRWTTDKKKRIMDSRVDLTQRITRCLAEASPRPASLLCGSAVGYYGSCGEQVLEESAGNGADFLATVCRGWEDSARRAEQLGVRVVRLRTGFVLAKQGGAFPLMRMAFDWGVGGRLGDGRQFVPWIHLQDEARLILWAALQPQLTGALNLSAPTPVTNAELTKKLASAMNRWPWMHAPKLALQLALGELSTMVLGSQRAVPARAMAEGFAFDFPNLETALTDLLA